MLIKIHILISEDFKFTLHIREVKHEKVLKPQGHGLSSRFKTCFASTLKYIVIYLMSVYQETLRVSIAENCTFHLNLKRPNATNHLPRASFQLIYGSRGLQCHLSLLKDFGCKLRYIVANVLWRIDQIISITIKY